jgi:hypothetical protein
MLSHMKRRLGVIAAVAVLAALTPALSTSVASAAPATTATAAADTAGLSACPTGSAAAAGFTDTTSTDVDCIKMYGITTGVTATTYEPDGSIPRYQMALFLTRAATEMSVTLGDGSDQGFTDISGYTAAIQTAINQIKQLGVTTGKTATTYAPADNVTKEEMAMFVERMLDSVTAGPGGSNDDDSDLDSTAETYVNGTSTTYNYTDIDSGAVTYEGHNAIVEVYNLGITGDAKTVSTFSPASDLTRAEMATWLTNAAAHSNLRPAGLVIQTTDAADFGAMVDGAVGTGLNDELHVSNRDASFDPIGSTLVDIFCFETTSVVALTSTWNDTAFTAAGLVDDADKTSAGSTAGTIENSDDITDASGNIVLVASALDDACDVDNGQSVDYYAWTGAVGDIYDNDTTTKSTVTVTSSKDATHLMWSTSHPLSTALSSATVTSSHADTVPHNAYYGTTVTVTMQMRDSSSLLASKNVARAGCTIQITEYTTAAVASTSATDTYGGAASNITTHAVVTDANGAATFTMTSADPLAATDNGARGHVIVIDNASTANTAVGCPTSWTEQVTDSGAAVSDAIYALKWDDTARDETGVSVTLANGYVLASATGSGASNTITALAYDQYGTGIAGINLGMTLTGTGTSKGKSVGQNDEGSTAATNVFTTTRVTNSSGIATWGLTRDSAVSGYTNVRVNDDEDNTDNEVMYWTNVSSTTAVGDESASAPATLAPTVDYADCDADTEVGAQLVAADLANDIIVVEICGYLSASTATDHRFVQYSYDSNDQFSIDLAGTVIATDIVGWEYYLTLAGTAIGADTRYVVQDNLDASTTNITISAASLTSVFDLDLLG